jgi:hypothetical protein
MRVRVTTVVVKTRTAMALWEDQTPVTIVTKGIVPRMFHHQHRHQQAATMEPVETRARKTRIVSGWVVPTNAIIALTLSAPKSSQRVIRTKYVPTIMTATRTIAVYATWGIMDSHHTAVNGKGNKYQRPNSNILSCRQLNYISYISIKCKENTTDVW